MAFFLSRPCFCFTNGEDFSRPSLSFDFRPLFRNCNSAQVDEWIVGRKATWMDEKKRCQQDSTAALVVTPH
jgi:hypothetical protein